MRESCSCGAAIQTMFYTRALVWRATHMHGEVEQHDIGSDTAFPTGFTIEADEEE